MQLWHIGVLTPDIYKSLEYYRAVPGAEMGGRPVMEIEFPESEMITGRGGRLLMAMLEINGLTYELLQPLGDTSYHAQALKSRGSGLHHTAFVCEEDQEGAVRAMLDAGFRVVWEAKHRSEHIYYLEAGDGSSVFEIINRLP